MYPGKTKTNKKIVASDQVYPGEKKTKTIASDQEYPCKTKTKTKTVASDQEYPGIRRAKTVYNQRKYKTDCDIACWTRLTQPLKDQNCAAKAEYY